MNKLEKNIIESNNLTAAELRTISNSLVNELFLMIYELFLLKALDRYELILAHVNHGLRASSIIDEKFIKKLSKEHLVGLAKSLEIVFYRGRFRMKPEDATKDNLINKILIDKKNKPLENPRQALTITPSEVLELFGDIKSS